MDSNIKFEHKVPWRSPEGPLHNLKHLFYDKVVYDLGCGSADIMVYIKEKLKCKDIFGLDQTNRFSSNEEKYALKITQGNVQNVDFEGKAETYYIWIENPTLERHIIERLLKHNTKCDVIICYNTKASCEFDNTVPNKNLDINPHCNGVCKHLVPIPIKLRELNMFLTTENLNYEIKHYNYDNGKGCRESGEFAYVIVSLN